MRTSLTTKIFLAIAVTAACVIGTMALLVALSMRDGFSQYLLRGELIRFDTLVRELAQAHDPDAPGWPDLAEEPRAWNDFVRTHFTPPEGADQDEVDADPLMIGERLALLDATGTRIAGATIRVLAETLAQTTKAEREWISNTSHELQTPCGSARADRGIAGRGAQT